MTNDIITSIRTNIATVHGLTIMFEITNGKYRIVITKINGYELPKPLSLLNRTIPVDWNVEEMVDHYVGNISTRNEAGSTTLTLHGTSGDHIINFTPKNDTVSIKVSSDGSMDFYVITSFNASTKHTIVIEHDHVGANDNYGRSFKIDFGDNDHVEIRGYYR